MQAHKVRRDAAVAARPLRQHDAPAHLLRAHALLLRQQRQRPLKRAIVDLARALRIRNALGAAFWVGSLMLGLGASGIMSLGHWHSACKNVLTTPLSSAGWQGLADRGGKTRAAQLRSGPNPSWVRRQAAALSCCPQRALLPCQLPALCQQRVQAGAVGSPRASTAMGRPST